MSHLKQYKLVAAIASHGGISQAAEALCVSQPSLSKQLKKIEAEIGASLFDRSVIPLRLTETGVLFLEMGERMADLDRQFQKRLHEIKDSENATIRIGISPSRAPYMLPTLLYAYRAKKPTGRVIVEERTSGELSYRLSRGELDMIISLSDDDTAGFVSLPLFSEHMLLAVSDNSSAKTAEEALASLPLITVGQGQAMWKTAHQIMQALGTADAAFECQSIESGLSLVEKDLGAMVVPSYIAFFGERRHTRLRFLPLPAPLAQAYRREICLFYRREQFLTQAERTLISCLEEIKGSI